MGLAPFVNLALFTANQGNTVTILGNHLNGTTKVTFNGRTANFQVLSNTHLVATVPANATSGPIQVTTPGGILQGRKKFYVKR